MDYLVEEQPLGTAGGVKALEGLLTGAFVVCNGDIFTDLDLGAALAFHREKGAAATIVLTHADDPTAFGMVETDERGARPPLRREASAGAGHDPLGERRDLRPGAGRAPVRSGGRALHVRGRTLPPAPGGGRGRVRLPVRRLLDRHGHACSLPAPARRPAAREPQGTTSSATPCAPASGPTPPAASPNQRRWSRRCSSAQGARSPPTHCLRGPLTLGEGCTVEAGATASNAVAGTKLPRRARLGGGGLHPGAGVVLGAGARVGPGCMLGDGEWVSAGAVLPDGATLLPGETA